VCLNVPRGDQPVVDWSFKIKTNAIIGRIQLGRSPLPRKSKPKHQKSREVKNEVDWAVRRNKAGEIG